MSGKISPRKQWKSLNIETCYIVVVKALQLNHIFEGLKILIIFIANNSLVNYFLKIFQLYKSRGVFTKKKSPQTDFLDLRGLCLTVNYQLSTVN